MTHPQAGPADTDRPIDAIDLRLRHTESGYPAPMDAAEAGGLAGLGSQTEAVSARHASLWRDAWRRLLRNRLALIGLVIVVSFMLIAIFAPILAPYGENEVVDVR